MRFLISAVAGLLAAAALFALPAAAQTAGTVVQPDGTTIQTTINGLNDIRVVMTGGPQFTDNPATVHFTSVSPAASGITYVGTITQGGATHPFTCVLDTATQQVTGSGACAQAFGQPGPSTPGTVVSPPAPPTTPSTPTTPTTPTVTTGPDGTTVSGTGGDGAVVTVTFGEQAILGLVEADQLTGALTADRMTVSGMQSFVNARAQGIWLANLASIRAASGLTDAGYRGRSAGAGGGGGIWFNATGAWLEDKRTGVAKDGQTGAFAFGADHVGETLILGGFLGYAATDLDGPGVRYEADGWSGGAYLSWSLAATVQLTGLVGYGQHEVEHDRAFAGLRSVGETERDQLYGALTLQSQWALGERWVLVPSLGLSASASDTAGYRDGAGRLIPGVETDLTTASAGAAAYWRGERVLPFVAVTFNEELDGPAGQDSSYALVGVGLEAAVADRLSVALSVQTLVGKSRERETSLGVTLRRGF